MEKQPWEFRARIEYHFPFRSGDSHLFEFFDARHAIYVHFSHCAEMEVASFFLRSRRFAIDRQNLSDQTVKAPLELTE